MLVLKKLGDAIRKRRRELQFTQEKFAQHAGIERARYGRIERGEANLTSLNLADLAGHLQIEPYRLWLDISLDDCLLGKTEDDNS